MSLVIETEPIEIFEDPRGQLIKAWPRPHGGEVYVVELLPGHPRGNHLHHHGGEWFVPLQGEATLFVETKSRFFPCVFRSHCGEEVVGECKSITAPLLSDCIFGPGEGGGRAATHS